MQAIVLAGARDEGMGTAVAPGSYRAGLVVGNRSLLAQALAALSDLPSLDGVAVVGPEELIPRQYRELVCRVVPPAGGLAENLERGLAALGAKGPVLIVSSDLPLLTQAALRDFLAACERRTAEVYYPIIRREVYEAAYPGSIRTYLHVKDGTFTGGNIALLDPAAFYRHKELFARAFAVRKHPRRLGPLMGWGFFLGLCFGNHTVAEIESRIAERLGLQAAAVESRFSEIGYDVDSAADLDWIEFYWGGTMQRAVRVEPEPEEEDE